MNKAKCIMIQGTMSGVGKSLLCTALCRIFRQDGFRAAPFKSQNMALNSYVTHDGLEMGRAQVVQAEAAGIEPDVRMNPILLKPSSDMGSQVIVNGIVRAQMSAMEYFQYKKELMPEVLKAYEGLAAEYDVIVIEGAGSPAEINLRDNDIVNMGLAEQLNAPVLLVGDIDRGGVFAQLYGTILLLSEEERSRIRGLIINKFRGDVEILYPGLKQIESKTELPVYGVVPYVSVQIDEEDSLTSSLGITWNTHGTLDVAVVRLPHISNFTDFAPLDTHPLLGVRYVNCAAQMGIPDLLILPGTKNTMEDLLWLRQNGLEKSIQHLAVKGIPILGICGGYQMLGISISDISGIEGEISFLHGMELLPCKTVFTPHKTLTRVHGHIVGGPLDGANLDGYEIHMGRTERNGNPFCRLENGESDGCQVGYIFGTYLHGLFDSDEVTSRLADWLCERKGMEKENISESWQEHKERQYNLLADRVRQSLDMDAIYQIMEGFI